MKTNLENIASDNSWSFKYARPDYLAGDNGADTPNEMIEGSIGLFCDPIESTPILNEHGVRQGYRFTGRFMLLEKSEIDQKYETKYEDFIEPMKPRLEVIERELGCQGFTIESWRFEEIINEHWSNMDGVLVNFTVRNWDTTAPEAITTMTLNPTTQTIDITDPIATITATANNPAIFSLQGNTEGLTLTVVSETVATITGTPTANTDAVIVAKGKFGGLIAKPVAIVFNTIASFDITINGDVYGSIEDDTDIPVINSAATPVGTIDGLNVEIADSSVAITVNNTAAVTKTVAAEATASQNIAVLDTLGSSVGNVTPSVNPSVTIPNSTAFMQINGGSTFPFQTVRAANTVSRNLVVKNTDSDPVGAWDGTDIDIADADISLTLDSVEVLATTVPAEGAIVIPIDAYIPTVNISPITYTNATQTVWVGTADAQNQGAPVTCSPDNTGQTGTFAVVGGAPAGVSVHATTGVVTYTFASLASGLTSFTVRKTGSGDYSGTQDAALTITKRTRDLPQTHVFETATARLDASWNFYDDEGYLTKVGATNEVSAVTNLGGTTWTQATAARRYFIAQYLTRMVLCGINTDNLYTGTLASNFSTSFTFYAVFGRFNKGNSSGLYLLSTGTTNYIGTSPSGFTIRSASGTQVTYTLTDQQFSKICGQFTVLRFHYRASNNSLTIYNEDGTVFTGTNALNEANAFLTTNLRIGDTTTGIDGLIAEYFTTEGIESANDTTFLLNHFKYNAGINPTPPFL